MKYLHISKKAVILQRLIAKQKDILKYSYLLFIGLIT